MKFKNHRIASFFLLLMPLFITLIAYNSPKISAVMGNTSSDFTAPVIIDVNHSPLNPTESDVITIGCNVTDDSGIYNVTLHYSVNRGLYMKIEMIVSFAFPEIYMVDIGPFAEDDLIHYYITAYDASGNWNEGINDNGGLLFSFTILPVIPEFNINPILMIMTTLGLVSLVYLTTNIEK